MTWIKHIAPVAAAVTIAAGGLAGPAVGATTTHWTSAKCASYKASFLKAHKKPTKAQLAAGDADKGSPEDAKPALKAEGVPRIARLVRIQPTTR